MTKKEDDYLDKDMVRWNLELFLAKSIVTGTEYMLSHGPKGYPNELIHLGEDRAVAKWKTILRKIHDGFKTYYDSGGDFYEWKDGKEPPNLEMIKNPDGSSTSKPRPPGFDKKYKLIVNKKKLRQVEEAKELLVAWYEHLWD
jgi:hypothetical protein